MVLVPLGRGQTTLEGDSQTGAVEGLPDVMRGQGIAGKEYVQVAAPDELADMLDAAGVHHGGPEHGQDLLTGFMGAAHGGRQSRGP